MTEDEIELEQKRARKARRKLFYGFAAVLALFLGAMGYEYSRDSPPPDDADMFTPLPVVPKEQNGLVLLRAWADMPDFEKFAESRGIDEETADKIRVGEIANDALADEFLAQARPAFAKLDGILAQPYFVFDEPVDIKAVGWRIGPLLNLTKALSLSARRYQSLGEYDEAAKSAARLGLLARRLGESRGLLIDLLLAQAVQGYANKATIQLLNDPALPPGTRVALAAAYDPPVGWVPALQQAFRLEYQLLVSGIKSIKDAGTAAQLIEYNGFSSKPGAGIAYAFWFMTFRPNETLQQGLPYYRAAIRTLRGPYVPAKFTVPELDAYLEPTKPKWLAPARPNYLGREILAALAPSLSGVEVMAYRSAAQDELVRTALALRHYYDDQRTLPAKLDDLVPKYLPAMPIDPFDGKPLRYDPKRGLIYSVGRSLKDSGGSAHLGKSKETESNYEEPLYDREQPTLELTFQNPPVKSGP